MKTTLFLRTFLGYAAVIALLAVAVTMFAPPLMRTHHVEERAAGLEHMALLLEPQILPYVTGEAAGDLEGLVQAVGPRTGTRITVINADGSVLADTEEEPRDMENHLFRPEIQASLRGEKLMSIRPSSTLKADMMYLSIPLRAEGRVVGALRLSLFMEDIESLLKALRSDLLKVVGVVTLVALGLASFLTRSVTGPVREAIDASKRVAAGDFDAAVSTRRGGELRDLALGFNAMAGRLKDMFEETQVRGEEIRGILASIREGLCVLDKDGRVVLCNDSFRRIAHNDSPEGRLIWEVVRSSDLVDIVRRLRGGGTAPAKEVTVGDRTYFGSVTRLAAGDLLVVTLHDLADFRASA